MGETTRRRETTRQRLLDAAEQVFAEVGFDATSVEAVSERAGFTRGAFYSNFDTKEELFLELCARFANARVAQVQERVAHLEAQGELRVTPESAASLVEQVLDLPGDDVPGVLLMSEIRIRALRNPAVAERYLAQDAEMRLSVARTVGDLAQALGIDLAIPAEEAARLLLMVWEGSVSRAVMARVDRDELHRRVSDAIASVARLLISGG